MKSEAMLVRALIALSKRILADANEKRESERAWPCGQSWGDLAGSSQNIFMRAAREEAGIPHDEYRAIIESLPADLLNELDLLFES